MVIMIMHPAVMGDCGSTAVGNCLWVSQLMQPSCGRSQKPSSATAFLPRLCLARNSESLCSCNCECAQAILIQAMILGHQRFKKCWNELVIATLDLMWPALFWDVLMPPRSHIACQGESARRAMGTARNICKVTSFLKHSDSLYVGGFDSSSLKS